MSGIEDRVRQLYMEHFGDGTRLAFVLTGDLTRAEDVAQEAFIRAAGRLRALQSSTAFWPYYRTTIVNCVRDEARRASRRAAKQHLAPGWSPPPIASTEAWVVENNYLWEKLRSLNGRQRAVIVLRYYEDLPDDEIARLLRCKRSTVRSLAMRGLQALRVAIGEEDER